MVVGGNGLPLLRVGGQVREPRKRADAPRSAPLRIGLERAERALPEHPVDGSSVGAFGLESALDFAARLRGEIAGRDVLVVGCAQAGEALSLADRRP